MRTKLLAAALVLLTLVAFLPALRGGFVYDDIRYVTANEQVRGGVGAAGLRWAFTSTYASNWHPLTWLSHQLDVGLFGLDPRGPHLVNLALHAANAALFFLLLNAATGRLWRSLFAAALFALHPLRVESVAWVAERKDVLSVFFGLLALGAYRRGLARTGRPGMALAALGLALSLLAKPTLVTLPLLLLLLDWWPLGRRARPGAGSPWARLVGEKAPLFALAALSAAATLFAQRQAMPVLELLAIPARLEVALRAVFTYLGRSLWPAGLSVFYPFPGSFHPPAACALAVALLLAVAAALILRRPLPELAVGWLWYLVALVPVIGLVQVGAQSSADRYTYVPSLGLAVAGSWMVARLAGGRRLPLAAAGAVALSCLAALSFRQATFWEDNATLFRHAAAVTPGNHLAHFNLAVVLGEAGDAEGSIWNLRQAVAFRPDFVAALAALARALEARGDAAEAAFHYRQVLRVEPGNAAAHYHLGVIHAQRGEVEEAARRFREALRLEPGLTEARRGLELLGR
jgi:tetratricopeptide (TPR) repeat protein